MLFFLGEFGYRLESRLGDLSRELPNHAVTIPAHLLDTHTPRYKVPRKRDQSWFTIQQQCLSLPLEPPHDSLPSYLASHPALL